MRGTTALAIALLLSIAVASSADAYPRPGITRRVTLPRDGSLANASTSPAISANGRYIAYVSTAANVVPRDTNDHADVFVWDGVTGQSELVSVSNTGKQANFAATNPAISRDGRFIAFASQASNLVPNDTNPMGDVFVRDRVRGTTERVSVSSDGAQAQYDRFALEVGASFRPAISADGRYIAFASAAVNLVSGDTNGLKDVFVRDRVADTTVRVSVAADGSQSNGSSTAPAISGAGHRVAFESDATNLASDDLNRTLDVFVRDRKAKTTLRASVANDGSEGDGASRVPTLSADGRYVGFVSSAANLVPGDTNAAADAFVRGLSDRVTERVSVRSDGTQADGPAGSPSSSENGRYVVFTGGGSNLVPGDTNNAADVFVRDRLTGATERVSVASGGTQAHGTSTDPVISRDGRFVVFFSSASDLVPGVKGSADVYLRDRGSAIGILGAMSVLKKATRVGAFGRTTISGRVLGAATDPRDDVVPTGSTATELGTDITRASLVYRPEEEDLLLRIGLASLPPVVAGSPGVAYRLALKSGSTRFEVRAVRLGGDSPPLAPSIALYRCTPACTEQAALTGAFGSTGNEITVSIPLRTLEVREGAVLSGLRVATVIGEADGLAQSVDDLALASTVIPYSRVQLGLATAGTNKSRVRYHVNADLIAGEFSGTVATRNLPGGRYRLWVRACLGQSCSIPLSRAIKL